MKNKGILRRLTAAAAAVSMMCGAFAGMTVTAAGDKDYELIITEESGFNANMAEAMGFSFTVGNTGNIWGPAFINDYNSVNIPTGRFTEKVDTSDVDIFELTFADDTVNNPDGKTFTDSKYVFETEFAAMYMSTGYLSLNLNGTTDTGKQPLVNARISYSGSTSTNKGTLAFFDADGNAIGGSSEFTMSNLAAKNNQAGITASMQHLMVEVDLRNNTFSAWHSVVKTMNGSTESEYKTFAASDGNKIVDNQPLNASGATELVSFSTASHMNAGTNGFWIHSVSLEAGADTPETPPAETPEPEPEPEPGLIDEVDFSDITVANNTVDGWEYYDKDSKAETLPNISFAKSSNSLVMKKTGTDGETDYSERYRAMYRFKEVVDSDENSKTFVSDLQGKYKIVTEITPKIQSGSQFQSVVPAMGDVGGNPTIAFSMCINPSNNVTEYIASDNKPVIYGSSINNTTAKLEYEVDTETGIIKVSINGAAPYTASKTYPGKALHGIMYVLKSKALANDTMTIKSLKLYRTEGETAPNAAAGAAAALTTDMLTDTPDEITESLNTLPEEIDGAEIEWSSSNTAILGNDGKLAAQPLDGDVPVTMTAKLKKDGQTAYKAFRLTVKKLDISAFKTLDNMDFTDENDTVFTDNGGTHSVTKDGTIVLSRTSSSQSPKVRLYPSWGDKQFAATGLWVFETEVNMMDSKYQKAEIVLYDESGARITSFYTTNKLDGNAVLTGVSRPSAAEAAVHTELDSGSKAGMKMRIKVMFDTDIYSYDQAKSWYWNQPISAGFRYQEELLRFNTWFDKLVKLYHYTGDEKYAYTAIRQFMDYINVRGDDICWLKSLDVAVRTQCMPGLWMQLLDSRFMSPEVFTAFMKWCYVQGTGAKYFTRSGNWGTSESLGLYTLTINYPEFTDSEEWLNRVRYRYEQLSNAMTKSDYVCTELSLGYTDYTLTTLLDAKTAADDLGIDMDLYSPYTQKTLDNIEHLGLFMYWSSLPGVSDNQVGDGYSHRGNFKTRMESLGNWFQNEQLIYAATDGDNGKKPDFTSKLFPVGKKAVMRTNWSTKAMYFFTDADGGVGNHAHPDDNSIVVAAHGQYLLVDPLYGTYSASAAKTWLTSSKAHNLVVMNGKNQTTGASANIGTIPEWETNNSYDFVTTSAKTTTDAKDYKRSTFFYRDKLFIVSDYIIPNSETANNKYVQNWHYLPEAAITMDEETKIVKTNFLGPNIQVIPVGAERFTRAETVDGLYSEGQGSILDAKYTEYEKSGTGSMVFNTILLPEETGEDYKTAVGELEINGMDQTDASAMEFYLTSGVTGEMTRYVYYLLHNSDKKTLVTVDDFTTDASMLFAELDINGNIKYLALRNASKCTYRGSKVFASSSETAEICARTDGDYVFVDGSPLTEKKLKESDTMVTSFGKEPKVVKVNGEDAVFTLSNGGVYFGNAPSPDPSATPTPSPTPKPPVHGGGSSGGGGGFTPPVTSATPKPTVLPSAEPSGNIMNEALKAEIENHWAKTEIESLFEKGIVKGQTETTFGLENPITRAEFITLMVRGLELEPMEYGGEFNDVSSSDWYAGYLETAYRKGIFEGSDGNADPNGEITREQMAKMLAAVCDDAEGENAVFNDSADISAWARESVEKIVKAGLMQGRSGGYFAPKERTKRAEAFAVIYRLIKN